MKYNLINNHLNVSKICFGCEALGGTDCGQVSVPDITSAIHLAVESGINFFDTADIYGLGLSESRLSDILGSARHDIVIATKVGVAWRKENNHRAVTWKDSSPTYIRSALESSLIRLRLDVIPVMYSHWPDSSTSLEQTFTTFKQFIDEEKVISVGCSNYNIEQLRTVVEYCPVSLLQLPLNILEGGISDELNIFCSKNNIKIVAYNSLANGLLTGKFNKDSVFPENDRRHRLPLFQKDRFAQTLSKVAEHKRLAAQSELTLTQYALKWILEQPNIASVITGIKSRQQLSDNISIF